MAKVSMQNSSEAVGVYTYNWDTAFSIPVPDVNKAIVDQKSSPANFKQVETGSYTLSGEFGDWQVCKGGDGKNIRFSLPISSVQVDYISGKKVSSAGGTAIIEINLHYIPHTDAIAADGGNPMALKAKTTSTDPDVPVAAMVELELTDDPGTITTALIRQGLLDWVTANLADFSHVFSVVNLNRMIDQGQWGFVSPNYTSYAYLDGSDLAHSTLGVLCMTGDRTGEGLAEQISEAAIPPKSRAGFLVSQKRTLLDIVRPAICVAYPELNNANFLLSNDATRLYLQDGISLEMQPVVHDGSTYHPKLTQLTVETNGETFTLTSNTTTDVGVGITTTTTATNWYTLDLGSSKNGQTIVFKETQPSDVQHTIHQSPGSVLTELLIAIAASVALLILTIATDGAALVVGGLIVGLIIGADMIVPAVIEAINTDTSPAIDLLLINSVDPIKWTGSKSFKLDYAHQNISFQLGGDPLFE